MNGPSLTWYLAVAAILFATGALGVLIRRSPLIILLSLEIMLSGGNLALIAMSRHAGNHGGQIFALAVIAVAASEVVVGLGLIVAMARRRIDLDVDFPTGRILDAEGRLVLVDHSERVGRLSRRAEGLGELERQLDPSHRLLRRAA